MVFVPKGLYRKILIMTLYSVLTASLVIGLIGLNAMLNNTRNIILEYNKEHAITEANEINSFLKGAIEYSTIIANDQDIASQDADKRNAALARLYQSTNIFNGINIIDRNGVVKSFYPNNETLIGKSLTNRDYVQHVLQNGHTYISNPYYALTNNLVIVAACPIKDEKGHTIGLVAGSINLLANNTLNTLMENSKVGNNGVSYIVTADKKYIYHPDKQLIMKKIRRDNKAVNNALYGIKGSTLVVEKDGSKYIAGYASVPQTGWGVVVEIPENEALASVRQLQYKMFGVIVIITLLVLLITVKFTKKLTEPLKRLVDASEKVANGNYTISVLVESNDELGLLGLTFNNMVTSIREMHDDILNKQSQLKIINQELQIMANTDGLTKLYNHRFFQETINKEMELAKKNKTPLSLLIVDIDYFKHYNDLFGHQAGDQLLKDLANILKTQIRQKDFIARYGGEEFTIIIPGQESDYASEVAERLRSKVEEFPFFGREQQPDKRVTVSIGIASYPKNAATKEELIKLADEALYKAKGSTRNKVELYFSVLDELKEELNSSEAELLNTIKMLLRIINAKDKYTSGHSERVGMYATAIAEELRLSIDELHTIKIGAYLHDIGKIEINRKLLTKNGRLSEKEFEIIKMHSIWGAEIVKSVDVLATTVPLILYHHERFDGKGYPEGLKGDEIPLLARILAVADSFDAMTSNRPYRKGLTVKKAINELILCSGTQFDPEIVNVFLHTLEKNIMENTCLPNKKEI